MAVETRLSDLGLTRGGDQLVAQLQQVDPRTNINVFNYERFTLIFYVEDGTEDAWFEVWEFNPDHPFTVVYDDQHRPIGLRREDAEWDLVDYDDDLPGHPEALSILESIIMSLLK